MNLHDMIALADTNKSGNRDLAFLRIGSTWEVLFGNTSKWINIVEGGAEFTGEGETMEHAMVDLLRNMGLWS